jgi:hypothetical protein
MAERFSFEEYERRMKGRDTEDVIYNPERDNTEPIYSAPSLSDYYRPEQIEYRRQTEELRDALLKQHRAKLSWFSRWFGEDRDERIRSLSAVFWLAVFVGPIVWWILH